MEEILKQMTLEDKIALCSGASFWRTKAMEQYGIPSIMMCDGPHGLRKVKPNSNTTGLKESIPATCFPTACLSACSWDPALLAQEGAAIAQEAAANEVSIVLGPGACMKRDPLCGRNFEYFSEDPYLAGKLAAGFIAAAEEKGIGTSLKHYACNSQEFKRFSSDSVVDQRTLRELYLTAFEIAVKEGKPATVMAAYNKVNGPHATCSQELLQQILREEWGYEGLVVSDWGAMSDRIEGFRAGCDLNMPGGSAFMEKEVAQAVRDGRLSEEAVDRCALRVLKMVFSYPTPKDQTFDAEAHHRLARKIAEGSAVLLKNEGGILPLKDTQSVALLGHMAQAPRYQGAGSSHITPTKLISLRQAMPQAIHAQGCLEDGSTSPELLKEACAAARKADVAVVCVGLTDQYESEGFDRKTMRMPQGHLELIDAVSKANPNTVVLLSCGSAVEAPWADSVKAVLYMGLAGQAGGEAAARLLYGIVNPSGRLAQTWPMTYADCPTSAIYGTRDAVYREGLYVGYRYFDKARVPVRWSFGHGLSYTTFSYKDLQVSREEATVTVTNTGSRAGGEVVSLYVLAPQNGIHRPIRELKGFQKIFLNPGESRTVTFRLEDRSFAIWQEGWKVPTGTYGIQIGDLTAHLKLQGEELPVPAWQKGSWYENPVGTPPLEQFEKLLGHPYREQKLKKGTYDMDSTPLEMQDSSLVMKVFCKVAEQQLLKRMGGADARQDPVFQMKLSSCVDCSMSGMQINSKLKGHTMRGLLELANGRYLQGLKWLVKK